MTRKIIHKHEEANFRSRVHALWLEGCDTLSMSRSLQVPEYECERTLHRSLELKRALRDSLELCNATQKS